MGRQERYMNLADRVSLYIRFASRPCLLDFDRETGVQVSAWGGFFVVEAAGSTYPAKGSLEAPE